jgi:hypothetical protein
LNFIYINSKPPLYAITNAIVSYANQSEKIAQNVHLPGFTMVINDTSMYDSVLINGSPYKETSTKFTTTTSTTTPIFSTTLNNFISEKGPSTTSDDHSSSSPSSFQTFPTTIEQTPTETSSSAAPIYFYTLSNFICEMYRNILPKITFNDSKVPCFIY